MLRASLLSVAKRHGLIEAAGARHGFTRSFGYPWQNATASLKHVGILPAVGYVNLLSVAKRHGLIEAE